MGIQRHRKRRRNAVVGRAQHSRATTTLQYISPFFRLGVVVHYRRFAILGCTGYLKVLTIPVHEVYSVEHTSLQEYWKALCQSSFVKSCSSNVRNKRNCESTFVSGIKGVTRTWFRSKKERILNAIPADG